MPSTGSGSAGGWHERRSGVSPDRGRFVYLVRKSGGMPRDVQTDSWIAMSRAPWFTALVWWPIGGMYRT